jgi:hypothetical protein
MHVKLLIDEIVRQTTVLIAQLSTAAGIRAPLSHLADQVFLSLAKELEAQGVRRKVVADMFGLALRSYQLKFQRLSDSAPPETSLWQTIHAMLGKGVRTRGELSSALKTADPVDVASVLNDLVGSGLAYVSGRGATAVYGLTSEADRERLMHVDEHQAVTHLVWQLVATGRATNLDELRSQISVAADKLESALQALMGDGRIAQREGKLTASTFDIPVGAEFGWEAAVSDHFRAVATAIASKLKHGRSETGDRVGGATLSFLVYPGHPQEAEVYDLLRATRERCDGLWTRVTEQNRQVLPPEDAARVTFYFGQHVMLGGMDEPTDT